MAQQGETNAVAHQDGVTFDSVMSIALSDLLACSECDEPTAILVVGHDESHMGLIPYCAACYQVSCFSEEPVHQIFPTH
ncbi:MAG: hypothetical protein ACREQE_09425 [Candidatus Binataceae bacterium]